MSDSPDDRRDTDHDSTEDDPRDGPVDEESRDDVGAGRGDVSPDEQTVDENQRDAGDGEHAVDTGQQDGTDDRKEETWDDPPTFDSSGTGMRGRDVEVPMRVYKTVTVFSTLIAVVCVVGGFVILDRATNRARLPLSEVDPLLALIGIGTILFGAASYAFATRFRAAGMGRSKNDDDESADNG